jgi:hypothetical protein
MGLEVERTGTECVCVAPVAEVHSNAEAPSHVENTDEHWSAYLAGLEQLRAEALG